MRRFDQEFAAAFFMRAVSGARDLNRAHFFNQFDLAAADSRAGVGADADLLCKGGK